MPLGDKNYYKILQVDPSADLEVIAVAYKRLARMYHPDTNRSPNATSRMQEINAAYEVLKDPAKRTQYDRALSFQLSQSDAKYAEERRKREEAEAALRRAKGETEAARRRAEEERRKREQAEAAWRHTQEEQQRREQAEAEAVRRRAEEERRKREETETARRHAQQEQQQREQAEAEYSRTESKQKNVSYVVCLNCYEENPSNSRSCIKCGQGLRAGEQGRKKEEATGRRTKEEQHKEKQSGVFQEPTLRCHICGEREKSSQFDAHVEAHTKGRTASEVGVIPEGMKADEPTPQCDICRKRVVFSQFALHMAVHKAEQKQGAEHRV
jgi:curved DNA-binding protein CbpA